MSHIANRIKFVLTNAMLELSTAERMVSPTDERLATELATTKKNLESALLLVEARLDPNPTWYQGNLSQTLVERT